MLLSSTLPKPAVARYQRLYCTSQESTRIQRYTKIHNNTKTKETQYNATRSTRIHEKTQEYTRRQRKYSTALEKRPIEVEQME